jgi:hypothetical protein
MNKQAQKIKELLLRKKNLEEKLKKCEKVLMNLKSTKK